MNRTTPWRHLRTTLLALAAGVCALPAFAGDDHDHGQDHSSHAAAPTAPAPAAAAAAPTADLTQGEVVRWDATSGKITLRHGPIQNLEMPAMTMVFRLADPAQAVGMAPGSKVRFRAEQRSGAFVVTRIEPAAN
jgi:Cu/Ag efflux protein CusF